MFDHLFSKEDFYKFYESLGKEKNQIEQKENKDISTVFGEFINSNLIELGCHNGHNCLEFIKVGAKNITLVDCSPTLLLTAREKYGKYPNIIIIESFIEDLSEDKKYDTVVLTETLEHVMNVDDVLEKAKNLLSENGYLLISCPVNREGTESHVRGINKEEMIIFLKKHNLSVFKWLSEIHDLKLVAIHE